MSRGLTIPLLAYVVFIALTTIVVTSHLNSEPSVTFTYALDDPYIHLAIAKNLVEHGVYGVTPDEFASASSSPLWIAALGFARLAGAASDLVPLVLNALAVAAILFLVERILLSAGVGIVWRVVAALLIVFHAPAVPPALSGMENLAHAALSLLFVWVCAEVLARRTSRRLALVALATAPFLVALRYEGLAAIGIAAFLLILQRRFALASTLVLASVVFVVPFGLFMKHHGASFIPNPVLLKPNRVDGHSLAAVFELATRGLRILEEQGHVRRLFYPLVGLLALSRYRGRRREWTTMQYFVLITLVMVLAHATFANFGWMYRYEAYLMVQLTVGFAALLSGELTAGWADARRNRRLVIVAALAVVVIYAGDGAVARDTRAIRHLTTAMNEIHGQQRQMARFLREHYQGEPIAANDIGLIALNSEVRLLDLYGLANSDVMNAKLRDEFDGDEIRRLCEQRGVRLALVYNSWFAEVGLPETWIEVERWSIPTCYVVGDSVVSIYATSAAEVQRACQALESFAPELPASATTERLVLLDAPGD